MGKEVFIEKNNIQEVPYEIINIRRSVRSESIAEIEIP
jgi:hypothetical protein